MAKILPEDSTLRKSNGRNKNSDGQHDFRLSKKINAKKPTSFSLDPELLIRFKTGCVLQGRPMSSVLEELMMQFIGTHTTSQNNVP